MRKPLRITSHEQPVSPAPEPAAPPAPVHVHLHERGQQQARDGQGGQGGEHAAPSRGTDAPAAAPASDETLAVWFNHQHPPPWARTFAAWVREHHREAFGANVISDCTAPHFRVGDYLMFSPDMPLREGAIACVRGKGDRQTFGRVYAAVVDGVRRVRVDGLVPGRPDTTVPLDGVDGVESITPLAFLFRSFDGPPG